MISLGSHSTWTKSSYSTGNGACVEVKSTVVSAIDVQDSKHSDGTSPVISFSPAAFSSLVTFARS